VKRDVYVLVCQTFKMLEILCLFSTFRRFFDLSFSDLERRYEKTTTTTKIVFQILKFQIPATPRAVIILIEFS